LTGEVLYRVELPFPLPSVNKTLHSHWRVKHKLACQMKEDAAWCLKGAQKGLSGRFSLRYTVYFKHLNHDPDNLYSKYVTDEVRRAGIIGGDSGTYISEVAHRVRLTESPTKREYTVLEIIRD
jgi:hypothetical protein